MLPYTIIALCLFTFMAYLVPPWFWNSNCPFCYRGLCNRSGIFNTFESLDQVFPGLLSTPEDMKTFACSETCVPTNRTFCLNYATDGDGEDCGVCFVERHCYWTGCNLPREVVARTEVTHECGDEVLRAGAARKKRQDQPSNYPCVNGGTRAGTHGDCATCIFVDSPLEVVNPRAGEYGQDTMIHLVQMEWASREGRHQVLFQAECACPAHVDCASRCILHTRLTRALTSLRRISTPFGLFDITNRYGFSDISIGSHCTDKTL